MANDLSIVDRDGNSAEITSFNDDEVATINNLINVVNALSSSSGATRSIGEKFTSTLPITDPSVHALDGSVLTRGIYSDFVDSIAELASQYPEYFCTEQEWQDAVTQNGYCDKYVYDSVNQTVRLPKSNDTSAYVVIANTLKLPKQADLDNLITRVNTDYATKTFVNESVANKVTTDTTQTISGSKTFTSPITSDINVNRTKETSYVNSTSVFDTANGGIQTKTVTENFTMTLTMDVNETIVIYLINGGNYTVTFPSNLMWAGGEVPSLTENGTDCLIIQRTTNGYMAIANLDLKVQA